MSIIYLKEKVAQRIWNNYVDLVRRDKTGWHQGIIPFCFLGACISWILFLHHHGFFYFFMSSIFSFLTVLNFKEIFSFLNFNKNRDNYFQKIKKTFPALSENSIGRFYFQNQENIIFDFYKKDIDFTVFLNLFVLNENEFENIKDIELNSKQKDYILSELKNTGQLTFYNLQELCKIDDEIIRQQENLYKKNLLPHKDFLNHLSIKTEFIEVGSLPKYKLKEML